MRFGNADELLGRAPRFPREIEDGIDRYLAATVALEVLVAARLE